MTVLPEGYLQGSQGTPRRGCLGRRPRAPEGETPMGTYRCCVPFPPRPGQAKSERGRRGAGSPQDTHTTPERLLSLAHPPRPRPAHARGSLLPSRFSAKTEKAQPGAGRVLRGRGQRRGDVEGGVRMAGGLDQRERPPRAQGSGRRLRRRLQRARAGPRRSERLLTEKGR